MMYSKHFIKLDNKHFDQSYERVSDEDCMGIKLILYFELVILLLNLLYAVFESYDGQRFFNLIMNGVYASLAFLLYYKVLLKHKNTNYIFWIYVIMEPMLLIAMLSGTIKDRTSLSFTFMYLIMILPILILDKPWRITLFILLNAVVFGVVDVNAKTQALFAADLLHLFNACLMGIAASVYVLSVRMRNIIYAEYFAAAADRDPLTGLYNRRGAVSRIRFNDPGILVYIDLDRFKMANDQFGHAEGDRILKETAEVLRENFRREDTVVRMGGDEFAVFAPGEWNEEEIRKRLKVLLKNIECIRLSEKDTESGTISASIGCVNAPHGCTSLEQMMDEADQKMYEIKHNGKGGWIVSTI